jgi:hypothetical protein
LSVHHRMGVTNEQDEREVFLATVLAFHASKFFGDGNSLG